MNPKDRSGLLARLGELKAERKALVLAHNYQRPEVQDAADVVGDSLALAREAAGTDAEVILFCGVHFMAETASILSPEKTVLLPDPNAGCPLANWITERELREALKGMDDPTVITYVNSSATTKALSHLCCTSANAVRVLEAADPGRPVFFIPDRNLGAWAAQQAGRADVTLWGGYCPTHERILPEDVDRARREHPGAPVVVHPECRPQVVEKADHVASTSGMIRFCGESSAREFIIGTEIGMLHPLAKANPKKRFHALSELADCPDMKLTTLEKMVWSLEDMAPAVTVPEEIRLKALESIRKMVEIL